MARKYLRKGGGKLASAARKHSSYAVVGRSRKRRGKKGFNQMVKIKDQGRLHQLFPPRMRMWFRLGYSTFIPVASFGGAGHGNYIAQIVMSPYVPMNATGYSLVQNLPNPYDVTVTALTAKPLGFTNLWNSDFYNNFRPLKYKCMVDIMPDSTADQLSCCVYAQGASNAPILTDDFDRATEIPDARVFTVGVAQQRRRATISRMSGYYAGKTPIQVYNDTNNLGTVAAPAISPQELDAIYIHLQNAQQNNPAQVVMINVQAYFYVELCQLNYNSFNSV